MPNTPSYRKTMKTDAKRRLRNRAARSFLRNLIKNYRTLAAGTDAQAAADAYREVSKRLDQAAAKKFIHKNKASRLKSRLSQLIAKPAAPAANA